jgi:Holliday junction resolvase RusA-like endonuclease
MPPEAFSVVLPMPPSLNNIYATVGKRRVKVLAYTDWRHMSALIIAGSRVPYIGGAISVQIELPIKMRGDIDNRVKPILDALVASKRIDDDRNVVAIYVARTRNADDVLVTVSARSAQKVAA